MPKLSNLLVLTALIGFCTAQDKDPSKPVTKDGNCEYWVEKTEEFNSFKYRVVDPVGFTWKGRPVKSVNLEPSLIPAQEDTQPLQDLFKKAVPGVSPEWTVTKTQSLPPPGEQEEKCSGGDYCGLLWQQKMVSVDYVRSCQNDSIRGNGRKNYHVDVPAVAENGYDPKGRYMVCYKEGARDTEKCGDAKDPAKPLAEQRVRRDLKV